MQKEANRPRIAFASQSQSYDLRKASGFRSVKRSARHLSPPLGYATQTSRWSDVGETMACQHAP
ncbi:hypothetical protein DFJ66_2604 [Saccharothrix variisporea]|uniref:Uncharacterized protein n=1 Tax=Saccharothrix variisporea TaxID=543527 RepID=A0A495X944_9PSEU|nr:hypothetical protein DFJ66_2604 [Saccharothrix variisporea]